MAQTYAWIESKLTMINEKERALSLEFCGEISHLGIRDGSKAEQIRTLASKQLSTNISLTAINTLNANSHKIILFAFGELQPDFAISDAVSEFIPFLAEHRLINANRVDVHGIKKGAWVGSQHPSVFFPKLISTSVVILPAGEEAAKLAEYMSVLLRCVKREPLYDQRKSKNQRIGRRPDDRAVGT